MSICASYSLPYLRTWSYDLQRVTLFFCIAALIFVALFLLPTSDVYADSLSDQTQIEQTTWHPDDIQEDGVDELLPTNIYFYRITPLHLRKRPVVQLNLSEFTESIYAPPQ